MFVNTFDTDIVVILIGKFHYFTTLNLNANIWVAFDSRRIFSFLHINTIPKPGKREIFGIAIFSQLHWM